ncbi:MAG: hypothetical protein J0H82_25945 [Alphaproteobacteria bacterium]|nr:hypothetical protein [Alphaproteobacteria bacterium]
MAVLSQLVTEVVVRDQGSQTLAAIAGAWDSLGQAGEKASAANDRAAGKVSAGNQEVARSYAALRAAANDVYRDMAAAAQRNQAMQDQFSRSAAAANDNSASVWRQMADKVGAFFGGMVEKIKGAFGQATEATNDFQKRQDQSVLWTIAKWAALGAAVAFSADVAINGWDKATARVGQLADGIGGAATRTVKAIDDVAARTQAELSGAYDKATAAVEDWANRGAEAYARISAAAERWAERVGAFVVNKAFEIGADLLAAYSREVLQVSEALTKLSAQTGLSVAALSAQRQQAAALGVDAKELQAALKRVGDAIEGVGDQGRATRDHLKDMRIGLDGLSRSDAQAVLAKIAGEMQAYGASADRATIAGKVFGDSLGNTMLPALAQGEEAFKRAAAEGARYGVVITDAQAAAFERMRQRQEQREREEKAYAERVKLIWADLAAKFSDISASNVGSLDKLGAGWNAVIDGLNARMRALRENMPVLKAISDFVTGGDATAFADSIAGGLKVPTGFKPPTPAGSSGGSTSSVAAEQAQAAREAAATNARLAEQKRILDDMRNGVRDRIALEGQAQLQQDIAAAKDKARADVLAKFPQYTDEQREALEPQIKAMEALYVSEVRIAAERKRRAQEEADFRKAAEEHEEALKRQVELEQKKDRALDDHILKLEAQARAAGDLTTEQKAQQAVLEAQALLYDEQGRKLRDLTQSERDRIAAAVELKAQNEQIKKAQEEQKRVIDRTTDDVVKYGSDAFADMFQRNSRGWRGMLADFQSSFRAALARMAAEAFLRPIIQPIVASVVGSVPSLFGLAGSTGAAGATSSGGLGSILSPITDAIGIAKSFLGDAIGGVSSWVNGIGTSLGFGSGIAAAAPSAAFIGPMPLATGALGTTTSLSGLLGGAGAGFGAGMLLNSLLGGSQVGGMIGSGVGSLGGALAGTFLFPGVGTLLGGLLGGGAGGIIGGLFGKDDQRPLGNAQLGAVKNGRLTFGQTTSLDGYDNSREIQQMQQAVTLVNGIIDKFGLTLNQDLLKRGFEDTSNPIGLIGKTSTFDGPANLQEWIQRFFAGREGQSYLTGATGTLGAAFDRLSSGAFKPETGDDVLKMLDYASGFDDAARRAAAGINTLARQTLEWEIAARDAGKGLKKTVEDYIKQAVDYFGSGSPQEAQARTTQRQSIYGLMGLDPAGNAIAPGSSDMLTGRDAALAQARAQMETYREALVATGLTAEQAAAAIDRANTAQAAAINRQWDEADRRTTFGLDQRQAAANLAVGRGGDAQAFARTSLAEQHRQELVDAEASGMNKLNLERLKAIQLLEQEALRQQQIEGNRRTAEGMVDRQNAARVTMGQMTQAEAETEALLARQRQERWDAERSGMTAANREMLLHTQQLEREALAYQQAVQAAQQAAQTAGAALSSTLSVTIASLTTVSARATKELDAFGREIDRVAQAEQRMADQRSRALQLVEGYTQIGETLAKTIANIKAGTLDPGDQLTAARTEFLQQISRSRDMSLSEDDRMAAMTAAAEAGTAYRDLARDYYGGATAEFVRVSNEIADGLGNVKSGADLQRQYLSDQLKLMEKYYPTIATSVVDIAGAIRDYEAARNTQTGTDNSASATMNSALKGQFDTLATNASTYYNQQAATLGAKTARELMETQFGASRDAIIAAITDWKTLDAIGNQYYRGMHAPESPEADAIRVKIFQLGGVPTFRWGGDHLGGVRLVGEAGPELELTGSARYLTAEQTRDVLAPRAGRFDMPSMPRAAANDPGHAGGSDKVVKAVEGLAAEFAAYRLQSAEEAAALRQDLAASKAETATLRRMVERLASAPSRKQG